MSVIIRGLENEVTCKQFSQETTAQEVINQVAVENGLEIGSFKLLCAGLEIDENMTLVESGVVDGAIIDLALEVDGGKKKRKKKVYTTEKKTKHKHVNNKLRILSYYTITKDGTVEPTKLKSTNLPEGTVRYMANHWNRHYCGRTRVALLKEKPDRPKPAEKKVGGDKKAEAAKPAKAKGKGKKK